MTHQLEVANRVALQSNCVRRQVGAIIEVDGRVRAFGWNAVESVSSCKDVCPRAKRSYTEVPALSDYSRGKGACYSIHAEAACLRMAVDEGLETEGLTMWVTCEPCTGCSDLLALHGVRAIWPEGT